MAILFSNNASTTTTTSISINDTTIIVQDSSKFPTLQVGDYFYATLVSGTPENKWEIVKVTGVVGGSWTVERGQEGTEPQAWSSGSKIEMRITAGVLNQIILDSTPGEPPEVTGSSVVSGWQPYTPALTNASVGSGSTKFFWRREGESIRIRGTISFGSGFSITGALYFGLPNGLTIDNTKTSNGTSYERVGYANCYSSSVAGFTNDGPQFTVIQDSSSSNRFYIQGLAIGTNCNFVGTSWPFTWAAGNQIHIMDMLVPIAEWSSNINLVQEQQEFYSCDGTGAGEGVAANTGYTSTNPVKNPSGSLIPAVAISGTSSTTTTSYNFTLSQPLSQKDKVFLEFSMDQGASWIDTLHGGDAIGSGSFKSVQAGLRLSITPNVVTAMFSNAGRITGPTYGTAAGDWVTVRNTPYFWRWRIRVVRNANFAQQPTTNIQTPMKDTPGHTTGSVVALNLTKTFTSMGGPVKIQASGVVAASTLPAFVGMNIIVDGVTHAARSRYINTGAMGNFEVNADCYIPTLAAGSHTLTLTGINALVDKYCLFNATTEEFVPALATTNPVKDVLLDGQIQITGAATATISRYHICSGTLSDYTVDLPPLAGNGGKRIAFMMAPSLTKLVTIKGNGSELIDGQNTRVMWANESCTLLALDDESGWVKVAGKTIPMTATIYATGTVTAGANAQTKVPFDTTLIDTGGMSSLSNNGILIRRDGNYHVRTEMLCKLTNTTAHNLHFVLQKDATMVTDSYFYTPASKNTEVHTGRPLPLVKNQIVTATLGYDTGSYTSGSITYPGVEYNHLTVTEIPSW